MLKNHIKIAFRNLLKHKGIAFINIFGLTIGMACAAIIFLWVQLQLSYDADQIHKDRIYRLESEDWVVMPPYLRETAAAFPEVQEAVRFFFWTEPTLRYGESIFTVPDFALVDDSIFKTFSFDFISGSPESAFKSPNSIVLTESIAQKLFGERDALGQVIKWNNQYDYTVTGVVKDVKKFHMSINAFASVHDITRREGSNEFLTSRNNNFSIYLLIAPGSDIASLVSKINARAKEIDNYQRKKLILRPFKNIYFAANLQHEKNTKHGNINMVLGFSILAILILLIACINFINLTIAKTSTREKEIAVRKVMGAGQISIQKQFFGETLLFVTVAFVLSVLVLNALIPGFNTLTGEEVSASVANMGFILILIGVLLFTAFISGAYPSLYLAALNPVLILKGKTRKGRKNSVLSKVLITVQFTVAIALIIATVTVVHQLRYMQNKDLGMDYEQMLTCTLRGDKFQGEAQQQLNSKASFKSRLLSNPAVTGVTFLNQLPGKITNTNTWNVEGRKDGVPLRVINADPEFIGLFGLEIQDGRNLAYETRTDMNRRYLLNQEAVRQLGLENPVGSTFHSGRSLVIGVIKDFHFNSLHTKIEPMAISWSYWTRRACIKIAGKNIPDTIGHIKSVYEDFCPGFTLEFSFLDESFAQQYESEKRLGNLLLYFVSLAILLSCLGLFALSAFLVEQKTKEIGIRKVLGSTSSGIVYLLSKSFATWVLLANLIAWPIAYVILDKWLQSFAYHIGVSAATLLLSGFLALVVALLTVSFQTLKASGADPVDCLRYE